MRETAEAKAARLLLAGRVTLVKVDPNALTVRARVEGDGSPHVVTFDPEAGWRCDCPCYRWSCSHVLAVQIVRPATRAARRHLHAVGVAQ